MISFLSGVGAGQRFPYLSSPSRLLLTFILQIDTKAVAEARGYKNPRSVANRITNLKKRYNLPITASQSGSRKAGDSSPSSEVQVPVTPHKNKVTKARTTRGRAVKVPKKAGKATTSGDEESDGESDEKGMIYAAPKKLSKLLNTTTNESSGREDTKGFIYKAPKVPDEEEADASDGGAEGQEDGGEVEESEVLRVEDDHNDEV